MTEPVSDLFDLIYPSPVTLTELSSITISLELWRGEIEKRRMNGTLNSDYIGQKISLKRILPGLPTTINDIIQKHTEILGQSISDWLDKHESLDSFGSNRCDILNVFDNFACDFGGDIHYKRTVKRMVLCNKFCNDTKFRIACMNHCEDAVRSLWSLVWKTVTNRHIGANYVKYKMDRILPYHDGDEIPLDVRLAYISRLASDDMRQFARYFLPKLNELELKAFVAKNGIEMILQLFNDCIYCKPQYVIPVWIFIRDKIDKSSFIRLIRKLIVADNYSRCPGENHSYLSCELWHNAPRNLKLAAIECVLLSDDLVLRYDNRWNRPKYDDGRENHRIVIFLLSMLSEATAEQRITFWNKNWLHFVVNTRPEDTYLMMKLCFANDEAEITKFKENADFWYELKIQRSRQTEMTEADSNLFDIIYPSPPTLQELSSITISLHLCRCELSERRLNGTLDKFSEPLYLNEFLPDLPRAIETVIRKHTEILISSIIFWEKKQYAITFHWDCHIDRNRILKIFDDFVCDFGGDVHHTKTAKRMMFNDQFTEMEKFSIACYNCFEDDIRLLWPSVLEKMNYTPRFEDELNYWICCLNNKMDEFYLRDFGSHDVPDPIDEWMLTRCTTAGSTEYFWNRTSSGSRARQIYDFCIQNPALFARFYLPKLNEHQFSEFIAKKCDFFIIYFLAGGYSRNFHNLQYVVPVFMYIKDRISDASFLLTIIHFLKTEATDKIFTNGVYEKRSYVYCEVWNNAPQNLKSLTIEYIFSSDELSCKTNYFDLKNPRTVIFLKRFLLDGTFEQRNVFWHKNWFDLITTTRCEDSYEIMKLCFSNEADIAQFKENTMANCGNIQEYCIKFMKNCDFKVLDDFFKFWFPEVQPRRELKQRLLQSFVFEENLIPWHEQFHAVEELDLFINDAFDSTELANDFKKQIISSPVLISALRSSIPEYRFASLMKLIDIFENESSQQVIAQLKADLVDDLKIALKGDTFWETERDGLNEFLAWCLGSEDRVAGFKRSLPVDEILLACRSADGSETSDDVTNERSLWLSDFLMRGSKTSKDSNELGEESSSRFEMSSVGRVDEQME